MSESLRIAPPALAANESACTIALAGHLIPYVLRRSQRRTIGLRVDQRGLRVSAPPRASRHDIEALLTQHADWVLQKLAVWRERRGREVLRIVDGVTLPLLGRTLEVRLASGNNRAVWNELSGLCLTLCLRQAEAAGQQLEKRLRERALTLFIERSARFAALLGLMPPPVALSSARTRWGSCNRRTGIRLNWRLIHFPLPIVDYVVIHELAHLREMNHGPRFWAIVATLCPDYREQRAELRRLAVTCPDWAQ